MKPYSLEIDPYGLTVTVHLPQLFDTAETVASSLGIGNTSQADGRLLIRCASVDDLALLGQILADRADKLAQSLPQMLH